MELNDRVIWPTSDLPIGWSWASFSDVLKNVTDSGKKVKQQNYSTVGNFPVIDQGKDLVGGYSDDLALVYEGPLPCLVFGDHTKCVKYLDTMFIQGADGVKVLVPSGLWEPKFSYWALCALVLPDKGYSRHFRFVREASFPVPPLNEQKRIVAKLEALRGHSSRARAALEAVEPLLERFRQSVLAAAFRGDLTRKWREQHPDVEPAEVLLERIRAERKARWVDEEAEKARAKAEEKARQAGQAWGASDNRQVLERERAKAAERYEEPEPIDPTGLPALPDGWCWVALEEAILSLDYGTSQKSSSDGEIPVLRMGNVQRGEIDWSDLVYTDDKDEIARYSLEPDTVLFNRTNSPELVGKTAIFRGERPAIFAGYLIRVKNLPSLRACYLNYNLNSSWARAWCWLNKTDGVSQSNISAGKLARYPLPFCSFEEQVVIEQEIQKRFSCLDRYASLHTQTLANIRFLDQSILSKAFRGELVEQDPSDEPAEVLLGRIRAERRGKDSGGEKQGEGGEAGGQKRGRKKKG